MIIILLKYYCIFVIVTCFSGITIYNEATRWTDAKRKCAQNQSHLVTLDCGEKQKYLRELVSTEFKDEVEFWIGLNSRNMFWSWDSSESSGYSFVNFRRAIWPELNSCVYLDKSKAKTWRGSNCRRKKAFICERDNIFPEYDLHSYNVQARIEQSGRTSVELETVFELRNRNANQKDVPFTIVVPKDSSITEFSMMMNDQRVHATIEDCVQCSQDFLKSIHSGNITSKLRRSKVLEGNYYRVLTVSSFRRNYLTLC